VVHPHVLRNNSNPLFTNVTRNQKKHSWLGVQGSRRPGLPKGWCKSKTITACSFALPIWCEHRWNYQHGVLKFHAKRKPRALL